MRKVEIPLLPVLLTIFILAVNIIDSLYKLGEASSAGKKPPQIERHCDKILEQCIVLEKQYIALYLEAVMQNRHDLIERLKKLSLEKYELIKSYGLEKSEL